MRTELPYMTLGVIVALSATASGYAQTAAERRAAFSTLAERVEPDTLAGRVHEVGAKYLSIRERDGETRRVRVDDHTKMDRVAVGDQVKVYVTEDGYASTIQRNSDQSVRQLRAIPILIREGKTWIQEVSYVELGSYISDRSQSLLRCMNGEA